MSGHLKIAPGACLDAFTQGTIFAGGALTMYLDGDTIDGDVVSMGGGPGAVLNPYVNFPIKDNVIHGNVFVGGWLICHGNRPPAQIGDSGGSPNIVAGRKLGQCAGL